MTTGDSTWEMGTISTYMCMCRQLFAEKLHYAPPTPSLVLTSGDLTVLGVAF